MKIPGEDLLCPFCGSDELSPCCIGVATGNYSTGIICRHCDAAWGQVDNLFACVRGPKPVTIVGELAQPEIEAGS
jgi:hypothetical protein